ncbi:AAA family ATPase [Treponema primitia]|uniref:AAA family ATPase n=1 Tax=Treponema primitia TaxID=88058 RepID=UPI0002554FCE|nr:AAA family ATPase [Treponema primitia]
MIPRNIETQDSLIGAFLEGLPVPDFVTSEMFTGFYQKAFIEIARLKKKGFVIINNELLIKNCGFGVQESDRLKKMVGGYSFVKDNQEIYFNALLDDFNKFKTWETLTLFKERIEKDSSVSRQELEDGLNAIAETIRSKPLGSTGGGSIKDLLQKEFPSITWAVPGLIRQGLTILVGAQKLGKSWLVLCMGLAVSSGGFVLGKIKVEKMKVLYVTLEDTPQDLQERLLSLGATGNEDFLYETKMTGSTELRAYIKKNPGIKMIIIDTFGKFLSIQDGNDYNEVVRTASSLKAIADEFSICVIAIHHTKKGGGDSSDWTEMVLGSQGLSATADQTMLLKRKRGESKAELLLTGRRVRDDLVYELEFDSAVGSWAISDEKEFKTETRLNETQSAIIDLLQAEARTFTVSEIAKALNRAKSGVSAQAKKLSDLGLIENLYMGQYRLKPPDTPQNRSFSSVPQGIVNSVNGERAENPPAESPKDIILKTLTELDPEIVTIADLSGLVNLPSEQVESYCIELADSGSVTRHENGYSALGLF